MAPRLCHSPQFAQAVLKADDRWPADAIAGVECGVTNRQPSPVGAKHGDQVAQVEEPSLRGGVVDKRIVHLDGRDAAGEAPRKRRRSLAFAAGDIEK